MTFCCTVSQVNNSFLQKRLYKEKQYVIHSLSKKKINLLEVVCKLNFKKRMLLRLINVNVSQG